MAQNSDLESRRKDFQKSTFDENLKYESVNSHFKMGNASPSLQTMFQSQFYGKITDNKLTFNPNSPLSPNRSKIGHRMGIDKIEYNTEAASKFLSPVMHKRALSYNMYIIWNAFLYKLFIKNINTF